MSHKSPKGKPAKSERGRLKAKLASKLRLSSSQADAMTSGTRQENVDRIIAHLKTLPSAQI